jgi:hypothetical protein
MAVDARVLPYRKEQVLRAIRNCFRDLSKGGVKTSKMIPCRRRSGYFVDAWRATSSTVRSGRTKPSARARTMATSPKRDKGPVVSFARQAWGVGQDGIRSDKKYYPMAKGVSSFEPSQRAYQLQPRREIARGFFRNGW